MTREVLVPARIEARIAGRIAGCGVHAGAGIVEVAGVALGTRWKVSVAVDDCAPRRHAVATRIARGVTALLAGLVDDMSAWNPCSALSRFNEGAQGWQPLPDALVEVLAIGCEVAEASGGAFDPTVGALVELWGFGPHGRDLASRGRDAGRAGAAACSLQAPERDVLPMPSRERIAAARDRGGWRALRLDVAGRRAWQPGGLQLDVSAVGKGYAVDRVTLWLLQQGWRDVLVEIGGELRGEGAKPDGSPWWVAIDEGDAVAGNVVVALHGLAVATSGDAVQSHRVGGTRVSHSIDPRSGASVDPAVAAVTVLHRGCARADAWATALTVLGMEAGLACAEREGLAARLSARAPARESAAAPRSGDVAQALTGRCCRASSRWRAMAD